MNPPKKVSWRSTYLNLSIYPLFLHKKTAYYDPTSESRVQRTSRLEKEKQNEGKEDIKASGTITSDEAPTSSLAAGEKEKEKEEENQVNTPA